MLSVYTNTHPLCNLGCSMLIDGKKIATEIQEEIKEKLAAYQHLGVERPPCLAVILVGKHPASQIYVTNKAQACTKVGMLSIINHFPETITERELLDELAKFNENPSIDGILVQLPLPGHIDSDTITLAISPKKDVDGSHPMNMGKLLRGESSGFTPCTPLGIQQMLLRSHVDVQGLHAVIVGRSNLVGRPMAALLLNNMAGANATVTIVHSNSRSLQELCRLADILIVAIGKAEFIRADFVREGAIVIDVGINKIKAPELKQGYRLVGDVAFNEVRKKCSLITPVPGGVGPMTIAMLLSNTLKSYERHMEL